MLETTISLPGMDKEAMLLCDKGMNSFLKLDIILFYHNKRLSDADINELARYTGRSPVEVGDAVSALKMACWSYLPIAMKDTGLAVFPISPGS
jgi:hypothetical protein